MTDVNHLFDEDPGRWYALTTDATAVRSHLDLFTWLRGGMQDFLPHDILLAAWGDFERGALHYDIVSPLPDVRTAGADAPALGARMRSLFDLWAGGSRQPFLVHPERMQGMFGKPPSHDPLRKASPALQTVLVHGLRDHRTGQDCLYAVLSRYALADRRSRDAMRMLLPCIDAAMRQVPLLPCALAPYAGPCLTPMSVQPIAPSAHEAGHGETGMTNREMQIMRWVEMGKTNQEIGTILDISAFTVKNHLQRIFKKLDVYNRAQAVSRFKDGFAHG